MAWRLRAGVSLHPMPFGGAFVMDDARLAARQISPELTQLLAAAGPAGEGTAAAGAAVAGTAPTPGNPMPGNPTPGNPPPPALAAELRLGIDDGWLIHQEENA